MKFLSHIIHAVIGWPVQPIYARISQMIEQDHMDHSNKSGDDRDNEIPRFVIPGRNKVLLAEDLSCEMIPSCKSEWILGFRPRVMGL